MLTVKVANMMDWTNTALPQLTSDIIRYHFGLHSR